MIRRMLIGFVGLACCFSAEGQKIGIDLGKVKVVECRPTSITARDLVSLAINLRFTNTSQKNVLFYKEPSIIGGRVAAAKSELQKAAVWQADMVGDTQGAEKKSPGIDRFIRLKPTEHYDFYTTAERPELQTIKPGKYWIQMLVSTEPVEFYYSKKTRDQFQQQWKGSGDLADSDLWTPPFEIEIKHPGQVCTEKPN